MRDITLTRLWYLTWYEAAFQAATTPLRILGVIRGSQPEDDG